MLAGVLVAVRMRLYRNGKIVLTFALLCGLGIAANPDTAAAQVRPQVTATQPAPNVEFRAMWVDAGSPGLHSPEEINQLLDFASANNFNALLVELHRKGATFAAQSISPPGSSAKFDGLATLIPLAHARGIEVHAWINVLPVWYGADWPDNAHPVFNEHGFYTFEEGPGKTGNTNNKTGSFAIDRANWLTMNNHGESRFPGGTFLDPGHPAAAQFVVTVCKDIVRYYPVDGLHLDFIRYPGVEEDIARGSSAGYNPVSLARFWQARQRLNPRAAPIENPAATGKTAEDQAMEDSLALAAALAMPTLGQPPTPRQPAPQTANIAKPVPVRLPLPAPSNQEWVNWRITQVSQLVRRIYLESKAINPKVKISAAVVTWGHPPTSEADFINSSAMEWVFQDWRSWLQQGALDMVFPMNYLPEHRELMRTWFDGWISWEKQHKYGRQVVVGLGANVNTPAELVAQIHRVRQTEGSNRADGVAFFSYDNLLHPPAPAASAAATAPSAVATNAALPAQAIAPTADRPAANRLATDPPAPDPPSPPMAYLAKGLFEDPSGDPAKRSSADTAPFAQPAGIPKLATMYPPAHGGLLGVARGSDGKPLDGDVVVLEPSGASHRSFRSVTDGNGYFGFTSLVPGSYRLRFEASAASTGDSSTAAVPVMIAPGKVSRIEITRK